MRHAPAMAANPIARNTPLRASPVQQSRNTIPLSSAEPVTNASSRSSAPVQLQPQAAEQDRAQRPRHHDGKQRPEQDVERLLHCRAKPMLVRMKPSFTPSSGDT